MSGGNEDAQASSALDRLPPELLVRVLYEVQSTLIRGSYEPWLDILLLCRRTWTVALDSPELWSRITFGARGLWKKQRHWRRLCVQRSQERPLDITIRLDPHYLPASDCAEIQQLAPRMIRCELTISRNLYVLGYASDVHIHLRDDLITKSWPLLQMFDIVAEEGITMGGASLLSGQSDTLTQLSITCGPVGFSGTPSTPISPRLRHLKVQRLTVDNDGASQKLRAFFSGMDALASLVLSFDVPSSEKDMVTLEAIRDVASQPRLRLPNLRHLSMSGLPRHCRLVLSMISETYNELIIDMAAEGAAMELYTVDDRNTLVSQAAAYATNRTAESEGNYEVVYNLCVSVHEVETKSKVLALPGTGGRRLHCSSLENHLIDDVDMLPQFADIATVIIFKSDRTYQRHLQNIASLHGPLKVLGFVEWLSVWAEDQDKMTTVAETLETMKEHGRPLDTIQLDCSTSSDGVERQWLRAGLVSVIKYTDGNVEMY